MMAILKFIKNNGMALSNAITYIEDERKTSKPYIFGVLMATNAPLSEFTLIKNLSQIKAESKSFTHVIFSLDCDNTVDLNTILTICKEVGVLLSQGIYQTLGAIHYKDEEHIHCHYIINSVGVDYTRYKQGRSLWSYKQDINRILEKYHISPIPCYNATTSLYT